MTLSLMLEIAMLLCSVCGILVAAWLLWRSQKQGDLQALAGFAIMMAIWCFGHVAMLNGYDSLGVSIILANPLMPTLFLHFAIRFVNSGPAQTSWLTRLSKSIPWFYVASVLVVLWSWWIQGGAATKTLQVNSFFIFTNRGIGNLVYTVLLGVLAHGVLLYGWYRHKGNKRRSILAMFVVGAWGVLLATSFVFPSFGIGWFPYPMLLLPTYLLLLVFAVVRYQILAVNAFANRALLWVAMMLVILCLIAVISVVSGRLGMQALSNVPSWQLWLYSLVVLLLATIVYQPLSRLISRLIYPGAALNESILETWSTQLNKAQGWQELVKIGEHLLSKQIRHRVLIRLNIPSVMVLNADTQGRLSLDVTREESSWHYSLIGWSDTSPGMRLSAEVFGSLFSTSCGLLERSLALAEAERKRSDEKYLVELGGLSAAMAHELRNPLNIIAMAAYDTPADIRQHIQTQLKRADRLVSDMLVYSGGLSLQLVSVSLVNLIQDTLAQTELGGIQWEMDIEENLELEADPHRLQQVFNNLIDNAVSFLRNQPDPRLLITAKTVNAQFVLIRVHNNGPAIEASLQTSLFQPFVTKRAGGSGLGLAIVRRVVDAHHGSIQHRNDLGWPVTFELRLPCHQSHEQSVLTTDGISYGNQ